MRRGGVAREGNIQIPSLLAQRITNARRNGVEYYYSTILATLSPTVMTFVEIEGITGNIVSKR